jgi:hypothetical protein
MLAIAVLTYHLLSLELLLQFFLARSHVVLRLAIAPFES